jgi:hypothetical protein
MNPGTQAIPAFSPHMAKVLSIIPREPRTRARPKPPPRFASELMNALPSMSFSRPTTVD